MTSAGTVEKEKFSFVIKPSETAGGSWKYLPHWLAAAFALRAVIALGGDFVLHPDEIMQYLEPAHRLVYGYGIVFWEFYYGARSWLVPGFVAGILWLLEAFGLGVPWIYVYVVKLAFCAVSLLIPWGVYHFARHTVSEEVGRLALIGASLWPYLIVFAHKPFTEFVATALFCACLGLVVQPHRTRRLLLLLGALLALAAAVRFQYLPAVGLLWLVCVLDKDRNTFVFTVLGGSIVLTLVGVLEHFTWGFPFHSYYINLLFNQAFDEMRDPQEWYFYLPRLLFVTCGGLLVALVAFATKMRQHAFIFAVVVVTLVLHTAQDHKEMRFIFLLTPLLLVPCFAQLSQWVSAAKPAARRLWISAVVGVFSAGIVSNLIDDRWIHYGHSYERGNIRYLLDQENIFDRYLTLAKLPDVKGVLHYGDNYLHTPGYYYLHQDVPLYDFLSLRFAQKNYPEMVILNDGYAEAGSLDDGYVKVESLDGLVSHAVLLGISELLDFHTIFDDGKYSLNVRFSDKKVRRWKEHSPMYMGTVLIEKVVKEVLGDLKPIPPLFEYRDL